MTQIRGKRPCLKSENYGDCTQDRYKEMVIDILYIAYPEEYDIRTRSMRILPPFQRMTARDWYEFTEIMGIRWGSSLEHMYMRYCPAMKETFNRLTDEQLRQADEQFRREINKQNRRYQ